jgi:hypothetical protein
MQKGSGVSTSSLFGIVNTCSLPSLSCTFHQTVPFHLDMPFDSNMPCILTLTFIKSPLKSNLLSERQYVDPESISMGNESVSKSTPLGNALTKEDALALTIRGKLISFLDGGGCTCGASALSKIYPGTNGKSFLQIPF